MNRLTRRVLGGAVGVLLAVTLTGCGDRGDLHVVNNGPHEVTVLTGDEEMVAPPDGGSVLLGYGCTPGEVVVEFDSGEQVVLPGPVCPDQRIVVGDGVAALRPAPDSDDR